MRIQIMGLLSALSLLCACGEATEVKSPASEADLIADVDEAVANGQAKADSARQPTLVGALTSGGQGVATFDGRNQYLAWSFRAPEGAALTLMAQGADDPELDTVLLLYRGDAGGQPIGRMVALNDDHGGRLSSRIEVEAPVAGAYVAVVRGYDLYGARGAVRVGLQIQAPEVVCGTRGAAQCGEGEYCHRAPTANCGRADHPGVCRPLPFACTEQYQPVCGCDGRTYSNACHANQAGVSVDFDGECAPPAEALCGGIAALRCEGERVFCDAAGHCGAGDQGGVCRPMPDICPAVVTPVCGCDGRTYNNPCAAASHGISVAHDGACAPEPAQPGEGDACAADTPCGDGLECAGLSVGDEGFCVPAWMRGVFRADGPLAIPDADPAGLTSVIAVDGLATVSTDVRLHLRIEHSWRGDLKVTLRNPDGTEVLLHDRDGGSADDLVLEGAVRGFPGDESVNGDWTLTVQDLARYDTGRLLFWELDLTSRWD